METNVWKILKWIVYFFIQITGQPNWNLYSSKNKVSGATEAGKSPKSSSEQLSVCSNLHIFSYSVIISAKLLHHRYLKHSFFVLLKLFVFNGRETHTVSEFLSTKRSCCKTRKPGKRARFLSSVNSEFQFSFHFSTEQ